MRPVAALALALFALQHATAFSPLLSMSTRFGQRIQSRSSFVPSVARTASVSAARRDVLGLEMKLPKIIQGGMGVQVSSWELAREVASNGELGIISGTAMDMVVCRWLQMGDPGGLYRKALSHFPDQDMANRLIDKYYIEGGKAADTPFKPLQMWVMEPSQALEEASVLGNFCEVWLAKHDDDGNLIDGPVGINCLTKIQLPTITSLYGAVLADADYVVMGAGIPMEVPGILDALAENKDCKLAIDVDGSDEQHFNYFSPKAFWERSGKPELADKELKRPNFLPIVSSVTLAQALLKRATGAGPTRGIQGFVIEKATAGGHNAPPRGFRYDAVAKSHKLSLNDKGEPIYGPKDEVDLAKFKNAVKGLPFWLAGYYARPEKLQEVLAAGGAGVQLGTSFAFSKESGLTFDAKQQVLQSLKDDTLTVFTDPVASPTGFPFKVLELDGSLSEKDAYLERPRVCNLGYLRTPYEADGKIGYRCASEPVKDWLKKGGEMQATEGRKCLCNGLMANAGMPQVSPYKKEGSDEKYIEETLITAGDDINQIKKYMYEAEDGHLEYSAKDVLNYMLGRFKEEYESELNLYKDAESAEDPKVKEALMEHKEELEGKIKEVDGQLEDLKTDKPAAKAGK